jgi:hypothetical protein
LNANDRIVGLALVAALAGTFAFAQPSDEGNPNKWLNKDQEQALSDSVPPPPGPNSVEDQADRAEILHIQQTRTEEMEDESVRDKTFSYFLFQKVYGKDLLPENSPKFYQMLKNVVAATKVINETAKNKYKRQRPYQAHPEVVKALFKVNGYSYPSGHAMGSFTLATVLGAIFPDKKQAFFDRAAQIAQSRVNAGVHYPSDIKEGGILGRATGDAIVASHAFQSDLAEVQAELKR